MVGLRRERLRLVLFASAADTERIELALLIAAGALLLLLLLFGRKSLLLGQGGRRCRPRARHGPILVAHCIAARRQAVLAGQVLCGRGVAVRLVVVVICRPAG